MLSDASLDVVLSKRGYDRLPIPGSVPHIGTAPPRSDRESFLNSRERTAPTFAGTPSKRPDDTLKAVLVSVHTHSVLYLQSTKQDNAGDMSEMNISYVKQGTHGS